MPEQPDTQLDDLALSAVMIIMSILRNLKHSGSEVMMDVELSYPQSMILFVLLEKTTATVSELSQQMKITPSVVSRMVDRLVDKDMVERNRDEADRRVVYVSLAPKGREFLERIAEYHADKVRDLWASVKEEDRQTFIKLLGLISQQLA
ncbi:MAG: MarR family winged helix-turn-helix transcriptional regulator [Candidatus Geothermincolia bacterium]